MSEPKLPPLVIGFMNVKRGDIVRRNLGDTIPTDMYGVGVTDLYVVKVDEKLIYAALGESVDPDKDPGSVWTFDRATGLEEDEELGWGIQHGHTGSALDPSFGWRRRQ